MRMINKILFTTLSLALVSSAMAESSCQTSLANSVWSGSISSGTQVVPIEHLSFNQTLTEMTVVDAIDQKPLMLSVVVQCESPTMFQLQDLQSGQLMNLQGQLQTVAGGFVLTMVGTKEVYQQPQMIPVKFTLTEVSS